MSTDQQGTFDPLAALREWSTPGRRAELVARAWRQGTPVTAIAEAARASRETIYKDLSSQGINPRRDQPQENRMITIKGMTGDTEQDQVRIEQQAKELTDSSDLPEDQRTELYTAHCWTLYRIAFTVRWYNERISKDEQAVEALAKRHTARQRVETTWEALADPNSQASWLHAHQAYVRAESQAHAAVDAWEGAAIAAAKTAASDTKEAGDSMLEFLVGHGVTPAPFASYDLDQIKREAEDARGELTALATERETLLQRTLGYARPA